MMIYADYNGSAPVLPQVQSYLLDRFKNGPFANPNAIHYLGSKTLMKMENARAKLASLLDADYHQVIFTSGATEGITSAFYSALAAKNSGHIALSTIEHSSVLNTAKHYEEKGFTLHFIPVTKEGVICFNELEKIASNYQLDLVAVMAANNETGVIQPYMEVARFCQQQKILYLCDTTQLIGKAPFSFRESGVDFAVLSGHKIGAMTGSGALLVKDEHSFLPLIIGGGQENGHRGGTQNYLGNETLALALEEITKHFDSIDEWAEARLAFEKKIKNKFPSVVVLGEGAPRLATTTYLSYPGLHGQAVQIELESNNIFVTTSSACSDNSPTTSKVLKAMGVQDDVGRGVVRISLSLCSPKDHYEKLALALIPIYEKLAKIKI